MAGRPARVAAQPDLATTEANRDALVVTADHVVVDGPLARGSGGVTLRLDGGLVEAERFELEMPSGRLVLMEGTWDRTEGLVSFDRAEVDLGDGHGLLLAARAEAVDGRWRLEAGALEWEADGQEFDAQAASMSLCACDEPLWSLSARSVTVRVDDVAIFRAGWLEVCEKRVVPLPAGRVSLQDRRTGLLAPEASWGRDGLVAGAPVMVRAGDHADLVLTPEFREMRGARGRAEVRYALAPGEGGTVSVAGGPDWIEERWRGQIGVDHGWAPGPVRTSLRGGWVSDTQVFTDFGEDLIARTAPWAELQGVAGVGPVRLEMDRFTADGPLAQRPLSVATTAWGRRLGGVAFGVGGRVDALDPGTATGSGSSLELRPLTRFGVDAGRWWGPVRSDVSVRTQASQPLGTGSLRLQ